MPEKLYWFLKENHAEQFLQTGAMYFGHCSRYEDASLTEAQRDSEDKRSASFDSREVRMWSGKNTADAIEIPFTSVEFSCELPDYFLRSLSLRYRSQMLKDLSADVVIEFFDLPKLFSAVDDALSKQHGTGKWCVNRRPIRYVSKQELLEVYGTEERMFVKNAKLYNDQAEFRITMRPLHNFPARKAPHLLLYLEDILRFSRRLPKLRRSR